MSLKRKLILLTPDAENDLATISGKLRISECLAAREALRITANMIREKEQKATEKAQQVGIFEMVVNNEADNG